MSALFDELCARLRLQPDAKGEVPITCPHCSKESGPGDVHCSYSERGYYCWVCANGGSLRQLWDVLVGGEAPKRNHYAPRYTPKPKPRRYDITLHSPDELARRYAAHTATEAEWAAYAPSLTWLRAFGLGFGAFPRYSSQCQHERLMVPLIADGHVVGFRGRAVSCDCPKWLGPGGNPSRFLYNAARLLPDRNRLKQPGAERRSYVGDSPVEDANGAQGCTVWIVENPVDAILLEQRGEAAVATLGVSVWDDIWTVLLTRAKPGAVVVAYDNDAPGNGGGLAGQRAWREAHSNARPPMNGPRLAARLIKAGLLAYVLNWGDVPQKTDVGDVLRQEVPA